jgi:hypothetical protein
MKKIFLLTSFVCAFVFLLVLPFSSAAVSVCCEKTKAGHYCQNVPEDQCVPGTKKEPTSCESTSFCKPGVCYNPNQGTCADNTPQFVCNQAGGQWSDGPLPQCNLGCCILGDQAAFVSLVRCKYLAGKAGLQTNYNKAIANEVECILSAQSQDKGACVYEVDFEKVCKFTTRAECSTGTNGTKTKGEFFKDKLCTAPELGTKCAKTTKTMCVPGKEEVYFVDNCGNPANIYDASKKDDTEYWTNVKKKAESCSPSLSNANSKTCGNCNYLQGSICRKVDNANINYMCVDLNCKTADGKTKRHGESWCVYNDKGLNGKSQNAVGSRFYKHICMNGEEVVEQCADFRQEECIQDSISVSGGEAFSQAACRVNRWQDCIFQGEKGDCENMEKRDCIWKEGYKAGFANSSDGTCLPKNTPGLKFWEGDEAKAQCDKASVNVVVTYEKGLFDGGKGSCKENCDVVEPGWLDQRKDICMSLGDCGPVINWIGKEGYKSGFNYTQKKA